MYPAMLNIKNKKVTVIGGGGVAYRKVIALLKFGACVRVVSPNFMDRFDALSDSVEIITDRFEEKYLEHSFIVIAATDNSEVNERISSYCDKHGMLCNVIDNPEISSFIVPAHMCQGDLVISVSTNGKSPALAKLIKKELEDKYDESYKERIEILGRLRKAVIEEQKDIKKRQEIIRYTTQLGLEELKKYEASYFTC